MSHNNLLPTANGFSDQSTLPQLWLRQALSRCQTGQWQQALLPLYMLCMDPPQWELHALLANALNRLGHPQLAVDFLDYGLRRAPLNTMLRQAYWPAAIQVLPRKLLIKTVRALREVITEPEEKKLLCAILGQDCLEWQSTRDKTVVQTSPTNASLVKAKPAEDPRNKMVDILVPVFDGYAAVRRCLDSVIESLPQNITPHRVIVLDDASPDLKLQNHLKDLAAKGLILYYRQPDNLGFIGNINFGMALGASHDVIWLNADTQVSGDWIDRLRSVAYSEEKIATVTPWSNNGEWTCFPEKQIVSDMPGTVELNRFNKLLKNVQPAPVEIPSGCGFCFYVRRQALNDVGLLNNIDLRRGYGEETEWSLRARDLGWKHLAATNAYVAHEGGVSFGLEKYLRVYQNTTWIKTQFADYDSWYQNHPGAGALAKSAEQIQQARLAELGGMASAGWVLAIQPVVIEQIAPAEPLTQGRILLTYEQTGFNDATIKLKAPLSPPWTLNFKLPDQVSALKTCLKQLPLQAIQSFDVVHHWPQTLQTIVGQLDVPWHLWHKSAPVVRQISATEISGHCWLIADNIQNQPDMLQAWINLSQSVAQLTPSGSAAKTAFVVIDSNESLSELLATGLTYLLPRLVGLNKLKMASVAGIKGALSLNKQSTEPYAINMAREFNLKLFSMTDRS